MHRRRLFNELGDFAAPHGIPPAMAVRSRGEPGAESRRRGIADMLLMDVGEAMA